MIKIAEVLMFIAFAMAALPLAFLGINDLIHFCGNPDALAIRDSTGEALFVIVVAPLIAISLLVGGLSALFFMIRGPHILRIIGVLLIAAWGTPFLIPETPFNSCAHVYWNSIPSIMLILLPFVFGVMRLIMSKRSRLFRSEIRYDE